MGWTTFNFHGTKSEFLQQEFNKEPEWGTILDHAVVGSVIYAALKLGPKHGEREGLVTALIIKTSKRKGYYNFGYKDMAESCAPYEHKCPKRILNLLSPVENLYEEGSMSRQWASEWRASCAAPKPKSKKIELGTVIKTEEPLKLSSGGTYQYFKYLLKNTWEVMTDPTNSTGARVKFRPSRFKFEIVTG